VEVGRKVRHHAIIHHHDPDPATAASCAAFKLPAASSQSTRATSS
jgi:nanoRNase/pAp phosphatase (c-di-AMP/oligoRNAs hydrolase)